VNTIHGSAGNTSSERHRRAASIRYIGDDVTFKANKVGPVLGGRVYDPMSTAESVAKAKADTLTENWSKTENGVKHEGAMYPLVWPRPDAKL